MEVTDIAAGIAFGTVFLYLGFNMTFRRRITDSLLASSSDFWRRMGHDVNEKASTSTTKIMIPIMGVAFMLAGIASLLKVTVWMISTI